MASSSKRKTPARATRGSVTRGAATTRTRAKAPVQIKWVRLGMLALLLIAAALFVPPLRDFFTQQTKYAQQRATLETAQRENRALTAQVAKLKTKQFVLEKAREDFQLVPSGMQVFVVKGLPSAKKTIGADVSGAAPRRVAMSLGERLSDLWHTILQ